MYSDLVFIMHRPSMLGIRLYGPDEIIVDRNSVFLHAIKVRDGDPRIAYFKANYKIMKLEEQHYAT